MVKRRAWNNMEKKKKEKTVIVELGESWPRLAPFAEGMKFAIQISPLLNYYFLHILKLYNVLRKN